MEEILNKLIEIVQQTAPELWKIAIRQAYVNGWSTILISIPFLVCALIMMAQNGKIVVLYGSDWRNVERNPHKKYVNADDALEEKAGWIIGTMLFWIGFVGFLVGGAMRIANPAFYAIQVLLGLISK